MAYRNVIVANPARISVKNNRLVIHTEETHELPLEDINALLIESRQTLVTAAAITALSDNGTTVYFCDNKHIPSAVLTPFSQHSRILQIQERQLSASEPLKKQLWKQIVQAKVKNQALCLGLCAKFEAEKRLLSMVDSIKSGDLGNVEASAAQAYFNALFGKDFYRGEDCLTNAALNYGYAIMRGCMARFLVVYGFLPAFGLHHHSMLNAFNLTDDMMEPYRPLVDLLVYKKIFPHDSGEACFESQHKQWLFQLLSADIISGGQHHAASYAMEKQVKSLTYSFENGKAKMVLPELCGLNLHTYE